jgi:hypothetical protein
MQQLFNIYYIINDFQLQYSHCLINERVCKTAILNFESCTLRKYKCTGISHCSYLVSEIRNLQYTQVTSDLLKFLIIKRKEYRA